MSEGCETPSVTGAEPLKTAQNRSLSLTATVDNLDFQAVSEGSAGDERAAGRKEKNWPQKNATDEKNSEG
jgi:hypothetical protein